MQKFNISLVIILNGRRFQVTTTAVRTEIQPSSGNHAISITVFHSLFNREASLPVIFRLIVSGKCIKIPNINIIIFIQSLHDWHISLNSVPHPSLPMEILLPDQTTGEQIILCRVHRI